MAVSINAAYTWAINTCNDDTVGYSQTYRNAQTVSGKTYYDCSSFIWYALMAGNFDVVTAFGTTWPFTTYSMPTVLTKLGFSQITLTDSTELLAGDILWRTTHTELVYTGGTGACVSMGAHSGSYEFTRQVSINDYSTSATAFTYAYRYGEGGAKQGYGYSAYAVAAMCGNFWQESHANPAVWESLTTEATWTDLLVGYGLGQWTNTDGDTTGRLYQLYSYLTSNGYAVDDGYGQLEFLIYEGVWYQNGYSTAFDSLEDFLTTSSTDLTTLTYAYMQGWEGIWNGTQDTRASYAQMAYEYMIEHAYDEEITDWISGNRYLSESEYLNNCVLIYRYLCLGSGGGTTGGGFSRSKGLKIWQMIPCWCWLRR